MSKVDIPKSSIRTPKNLIFGINKLHFSRKKWIDHTKKGFIAKIFENK